MAEQDRLFDDTDTLPLFSGTAQRGQSESYDPPAEHRQQHLGACPICEDTGIVQTAGGVYRACTCPAAYDLPADAIRNLNAGAALDHVLGRN